MIAVKITEQCQLSMIVNRLSSKKVNMSTTDMCVYNLTYVVFYLSSDNGYSS